MVVPLLLGAALIGTVAGGYAGSKAGGGSSAPAPAPAPAPSPAPQPVIGPVYPSPGYTQTVMGGGVASGGARSMLPILAVSTVATVGLIMFLRRK